MPRNRKRFRRDDRPGRTDEGVRQRIGSSHRSQIGDGGLIITSKELVQHAFQGMKEKRRYVKNRLTAPHREEFKTEQAEEVHPKKVIPMAGGEGTPESVH